MKKEVLCLGDSMIFGYGVSSHEAWINLLAVKAENHVFINEGMCGATTAVIKHHWQTLSTDCRSNTLILNGGVNDLLMGLSIETILANLNFIITEAVSKIKTVILLLPFKISENPGPFAWVPVPHCFVINEKLENLRTALKAMALEKQIKAVDLNFIFPDNEEHHLLFLNDGIHIQPLLHQRIATLIYEVLDQEC